MSRDGVKNGERPADARARELEWIAEALRDLQYGSVTVIVQDGVVVQIDRTEKRRLRAGSTA